MLGVWIAGFTWGSDGNVRGRSVIKGACSCPWGVVKGWSQHSIIPSHVPQHHLCWARSTTLRRAMLAQWYPSNSMSKCVVIFREVVSMLHASFPCPLPLSLVGLLLERWTEVSSDLIGTTSDGRRLAWDLHHGKRGEPWHSSFTVNNLEPKLLASVLTHWNTMSKINFPRTSCYRSIFFPQCLANSE